VKSNAILVLTVISALLLTGLLLPPSEARRGEKSVATSSPKDLSGNSRQSGIKSAEISYAANVNEVSTSEAVHNQTADRSERQLIGAQLGITQAPATTPRPGSPGVRPEIAEPLNLLDNIPFSAAVATTVGGRDTQFDDVSVLGDLDGREDLTADHAGRVVDMSTAVPGLPPEVTLTRVAISEHTRANGFNENIFYYGDSAGNLYVDATPLTNISTPSPVANRFTINLPTTLNAFGNLNSDSQIVITGIAVSPVADLSSFANVNGSYAVFAGQVGEVLYITFTDTGSGLRLASNNTLVRSGVLAYPIADLVSVAPAPPGQISPAGFPVQMGSAFGVAFSIYSNLAGIAVDDDGSAYFQQVDLTQFTGANIVKIQDVGSNQDRSPATNGFLTITTLNPAGGQYGNASGPAPQINRFTNYSGTSTFFGNIAALATGPQNTLYAAVTRSFVTTDDPATQNQEGLFTNPVTLGATPAMIIGFSDVVGSFELCSGETGVSNVGGVLPIGNGIADVAQAGLAIAPGVNNFRVFALGTGPDIRPVAPATSAIVTSSTLKLEFQVDFSIYSGLTMDEGNRLYVISGGTPGGVGLNPSPRIGEILCFEDSCPVDRRADYGDLRGNSLPNPPASGGNVGDGDSDRFDHIFWLAPIDIVSATPTGVAGLTRGFLRYTNRLAPNAISPGVTLGQTAGAPTQGDDSTDGPIVFDSSDPSHQVAGGDDQNPPFFGDDSDGNGTPALANPLEGGFEFSFGSPGTPAWNSLFLNSNGSVTFGAGDTSNSPNLLDFRSGLPKIAGAWADLNPSSRVGGFLNTFPVQALGFSGINSFKVRYINVPEFGGEACSSSNTFSISLFDDGRGLDENSSQPLNPANPIGNNAVPFDLQEGPTDFRWSVEPLTGTLTPGNLRRGGSGNTLLAYARTDLLGTDAQPVITGYSVGSLDPLNPPGLCETNLSNAARDAESGRFGLIQGQGQTASVDSCLIGEGTEPAVFELFNSGFPAQVAAGGDITFAKPDFDLRSPGNDPVLSQPAGQTDPNQGTVGLVGASPTPPENPTISSIVFGPFVPTPTTTGVTNAIGAVEVNLIGSGFFPNEVTTVCQGQNPPLPIVPTERPGKTVTTAVTLAVDTNGDGIPDSVFALTNITVVNRNLIRATLNPLPTFPGTAFPLSGCGGSGTFTATTTFTSGDNNIFGPFTRTATAQTQLGVRAPVVLGVTPVDADCSIIQDVVIAGSCFQFNTLTTVPPSPALVPVVVTADQVFAVEEGNPGNIINATNINVLSNNELEARFNLGGLQNIGKMFRIFVTSPLGHTSRNLSVLPPGAPVSAPLGNEQGNVVKFTCFDTVAPTITCPANITTAAAAGQTSKVMTYSAPVASDNLPGVTTSCIPASGSSFPVGTTSVSCTATDAAGNTASCNFNVTVTAPNMIQFSQENYSTTEGYTVVPITVTRGLPTADSVSVDYGTSDGSAHQSSDYTLSSGHLTFGPGEVSKTVFVLVNDDGYVEGTESLNLTLSNARGGAVIATPSRTLTILDNDLVPALTNPIDNAQNFVLQQYHDFLNREPDAGGLAYWADQISGCGSDPACVNARRVGVSAAFFAEPEFQQTGFYVYLVHKALTGSNPSYESFMHDRTGVTVGPQLDASKSSFAADYLALPEYALLNSMDAAHFVDALNTNSGNSLTQVQRDSLIASLTNNTQTRAAVLRAVAENTAFQTREYNSGFVLMQYFGYLRRTPEQGGFNFWLDVLNNRVPGNFKSMVCAFLTSGEYQDRFGAVRSHANAECAAVGP